LDVETILQQARDLGITLRLAGGQIQYGPKFLATDDFVQTLRQYKAEVLEYLREEDVARIKVDLSALGIKADDPHIPTAIDLVAWAMELAEQNLVLAEVVSYVEAPLRTITTEKVSRYAAIYLRTISYARLSQRTGGWGQFTREWWQGQEQQTLGALGALREAMGKLAKREEATDE
jgi:hypothetical protein